MRRLRKKSSNVPIAVCLGGIGDLAPVIEAPRAHALREAVKLFAGAAKPAKSADLPSCDWRNCDRLKIQELFLRSRVSEYLGGASIKGA
jgi:hypothetical protein